MSDAANLFKNFPTVGSAFGDDFTVLTTFVPTDTLEHLKNCGRKNTRKSDDAVAEFANSKELKMLSFLFMTSQVCASPNSKDNVIYLRVLCWASYRKFDKYNIYELAYPRLRDGLCRYSFDIPQTIKFISEPYATSPNIVSSNLILSASGIIFGDETVGFTFCIFCSLKKQPTFGDATTGFPAK